MNFTAEVGRAVPSAPQVWIYETVSARWGQRALPACRLSNGPLSNDRVAGHIAGRQSQGFAQP